MNRLRGEPNANKHSVPDQDGSDARLVAQSKLGNEQAFALLYRRYVDRIYDYSRQRQATREDAEDATQATFMRRSGPSTPVARAKSSPGGSSQLPAT